MSFKVAVTVGAADDIREILRWIDDRSQTGAATWFRTWQSVLQSIRDRADHFGVAPESHSHPEPIRQALFKTRRGRPYRALFVIQDMNVFVLHVRVPQATT
jgi:hypothetical protein